MKTLYESLLDNQESLVKDTDDIILIHRAQQWICDNVQAFANTQYGDDAEWDKFFGFTVNGSIVHIEPRTVNGVFRNIFFSEKCGGIPDWIDFDFSAVENIAFLGDNFKNYDVLNKTFSGLSIKWWRGSKAPIENLDITVANEVAFVTDAPLPKFKNCKITFNSRLNKLYCHVIACCIDDTGFKGIVFKRTKLGNNNPGIMLDIAGGIKTTKLSKYISKCVRDTYYSFEPDSAKKFTELIDSIPGIVESDFNKIVYTKSKRKLYKEKLDNNGSHTWVLDG